MPNKGHKDTEERGGLTLTNLSLSYSNSEHLFSPISYTFSKGIIYGIIGDSGLGKSTLLRHIAGIKTSQLLKVEGKICLPEDFKDSIAFIFQNSENQLNPIRKTKQQLMDINPDKEANTWENSLNEIGIDQVKEVLEHYPFMNSGGQNQRISWIISLFSGKNLLLADEPVANLDNALKKQLSLLVKKEYQNPSKLAILVSHDIDWLKATCNTILHLTNEGLATISIHNRSLGSLEKNQTNDGDLLNISKLFFRYNESTSWIINNFNFSIKKNEFIGLFAPSGKGKSTLLKVIHEDLKAEGQIEWHIDQQSYRQKTMMVSQNPVDEFNPVQPLRLSLKEYCSKASVKEKDLYNILNHFKLNVELLDSRPQQLSGGELQRMAIIKSLIFHPHILLLDESFTGLDHLTLKSLLFELHSYCRNKQISIIAVMHRKDILESFCDRIVEL